MKRFAITPITLAAAALLLAGAVPHARAAESGWYTGAGVGRSWGQLKDGAIDQLPAVSTSISRDEDSLMWKLFVGYSFTSFIALEANAFHLGEFSMDASLASGGALRAETDAWGGSLDALAILPLGNWRVFGRIGVLYAKTDVQVTGTIPAGFASASEWNVGYKLGAGVGYEFASGVGFRGEWEHYRINDALDDPSGVDLEVNVISASVLYRFK